MIVLTGMSFSPWSEKARWALDHHQVAYHSENYLPLLGELRLRLRMRKFSGRVTVPVLQDGQTWLSDSFAIAQYADRVGSGTPLFPAAQVAEIAQWNARSEATLAAGRAKVMLASLDDPQLVLAFLPPAVPAALKPYLRPVAKKGLENFVAKYRMRDPAEPHDAVLLRELECLAKALDGRRYLLGDTLSYADIAMAVALHVIKPVDPRYMAPLPGVRASASGSPLLRDYPSLITWRDALYDQHRRLARH